MQDTSEDPKRPCKHTLTQMPYASEFFVGRSAELANMNSFLKPSRSGRNGVVLQGISGSGKTQLALRYIDQFGGAYSHVLWISAASADEVEASFEEAANSLEASGTSIPVLRSKGTGGDRSYVHACLSDVLEPNWLMVLDSLDAPSIHARRYAPTCDKGSVLVISTFADAKRFFRLPVIELPDLDEESACDLLGSLVGRHGNTATDDEVDMSMLVLEIGSSTKC